MPLQLNARERQRRRRVLLLILVMQIQNPLRELWVHPLNLMRKEKGEFYVHYPDYRKFPDAFFDEYRMSKRKFDDLLELVQDKITGPGNNFREPISAEEKLVLTITYLAHGDSMRSLSRRFRLGKSTVQKIIYTTCKGIWDALVDDYMPPPDDDHWKKIEAGFRTRWNYPNCVGAIDGKHVNLKSPNLSGSLFFNYKANFSIVLMALVDSDYKFIFVDIGEYGSNADGAIFRKSEFGKRFINGDLNLPEPKELPGCNSGPVPHCIVGDEAFPLRMDLMRPFPRGNKEHKLPYEQQIYNYRLSRARRIVENAFGILVQRWRLFHRCLDCTPEHADIIIQACCILHNYLMKKHLNLETLMARLNPRDVQYNEQDAALLDVPNLHGFHSTVYARQIRDIYKNYFVGAGAVEWQDKYIAGRR